DGSRIFVARVHAIEVQDRNAAQLAHRDGELDVDHAVHRGSPERKSKREGLARPARRAHIRQRERDVDLVRIEGHAAGDERDLVKPVSPTRATSDSYLEAGLVPGNLFSGLQSGLIQGVLTPMN